MPETKHFSNNISIDETAILQCRIVPPPLLRRPRGTVVNYHGKWRRLKRDLHLRRSCCQCYRCATRRNCMQNPRTIDARTGANVASSCCPMLMHVERRRAKSTATAVPSSSCCPMLMHVARRRTKSTATAVPITGAIDVASFSELVLLMYHVQKPTPLYVMQTRYSPSSSSSRFAKMLPSVAACPTAALLTVAALFFAFEIMFSNLATAADLEPENKLFMTVWCKSSAAVKWGSPSGSETFQNSLFFRLANWSNAACVP